MNEAGKATIVMLPTRQYSSKLVEPGEQALDLPSPLVSTQCPAVLCRFSELLLPVELCPLSTIQIQGESVDLPDVPGTVQTVPKAHRGRAVRRRMRATPLYELP